MKKSLLTIFIFFAFSTTMFAEIILPSVFVDNMVLQQNSNVAIWGWSKPGETVHIVAGWNEKDTIKIKASNTAKWETTIKTISAGGPYTVHIFVNAYDEIELKNVMLGEVWICSGQSNMHMVMNNLIKNGQEEVANANHQNIRIFQVDEIGAEYPQNLCHGNWSVCSPETVVSTSAVGYFFARELQQKLNVPVGIIVAAWGGTPAEVWIEKSRIEDNEMLNAHKITEKSDSWPVEPGVCYNSMIAPIAPYGFAGAIWYQGESNCGNYFIYGQLMKELIENWRDDFKKNFPFYLVQIAPYNYNRKGVQTSEYLREQQELITKTVPNTGMVVVSDLVDDINNIHPVNKKPVGQRLAHYALAETYNKEVGAYKSPTYKSMQVDNSNIRLFFNDVLTGLKSTGKAPVQFLVAGDNHVFEPAKAKIDGATIVLSSELVKNPVAVRFCFDDDLTPDVFSSEGLPLAPFRTDKW